MIREADMKFGIQLAGGAPIRTRTAIKEIAAVAEELGFDSLLIGDHIVVPKKITAPWPYTEYFGGKTPYGAYTDMEWFDPFDTMAFLAGITENVRLGISVLIVPYRHPFDMARRVATIDVLSGGRFVLGVGVGWLADEFRLLNIPFTERAQRTREYIQVMKLLWTQEKPRFDGKFIQVNEDLNLLPYPLQKPHPPIWVGGESRPALRRVAEFGDGWHIGLILPERIGPKLDELKRLMEQTGRDFFKLELTALADPTRLSEQEVRAYQTAGVHVLYMLPISNDHQAVIRQMRTFASTMRAIR
jgi:probable F420-dependent oxidoreductase